MTYVVEGDALHGLVLLHGVHLVQVAVGDEHGPVLRFVEAVDLENAKPSVSLPFKRQHQVKSGEKTRVFHSSPFERYRRTRLS